VVGGDSANRASRLKARADRMQPIIRSVSGALALGQQASDTALASR